MFSIRNVFLVCGLVVCCAHGVRAADLTATAHVNVTSDTAATAKNMALDEARRQVIIDALSPYSDAGALRRAVGAEKASVLTTLVESSSIGGEKQSDTTYSANITMTLNRAAARNWMVAHDVQNWLGDGNDSGNESWAVVTLEKRLSDWGRVRKIATDAGIDLNTKTINGPQMSVRIPASKRAALTIALRDAGWQYQDRDGVLYIFK